MPVMVCLFMSEFLPRRSVPYLPCRFVSASYVNIGSRVRHRTQLTLTSKPASTPELGFHLMRAFQLDAGFAGASVGTLESWLTAARSKRARYISCLNGIGSGFKTPFVDGLELNETAD